MSYFTLYHTSLPYTTLYYAIPHHTTLHYTLLTHSSGHASIYHADWISLEWLLLGAPHVVALDCVRLSVRERVIIYLDTHSLKHTHTHTPAMYTHCFSKPNSGCSTLTHAYTHIHSLFHSHTHSLKHTHTHTPAMYTHCFSEPNSGCSTALPLRPLLLWIRMSPSCASTALAF
jgi:hypothetical protein